MYAYLLDALPDVLLYAGPGVWAVRPGFLTPTRELRWVSFLLPRELRFGDHRESRLTLSAKETL